MASVEGICGKFRPSIAHGRHYALHCCAWCNSLKQPKTEDPEPVECAKAPLGEGPLPAAENRGGGAAISANPKLLRA